MVERAADRAPIACTAWAEALAERIAVAREGQDIEGVHGVRTACARLDVFLRLIGWRALRDDLRWLRRAASDVRDVDVLLERELPSELRSQLEARRRPARAAFLAAIDDERCAALLSALRDAPTASRSTARKALAELRANVGRRGDALEHEPADLDDVHSLRRGLRRLRYAREWLGIDTKDTRAMQDELGALNDAVVAARSAAELESTREFDAFQASVGREIADRTASSLRAWRAARRKILRERA